MDAIEGIIKMNKWPPGWDNRWVPHVQWEAIPLQPTKNISWVVPYNWQGLHHFFLVHCLTKYHEVRGHSTPLQGKMSVRVHQNFGLSLSFSAFAIPWASICCSWLAHHWREDLLPREAHFLHHTLLNEYIYITHTQCRHHLLLSCKTLAVTVENIQQYRGLPLIQSRNVILARLGKKVDCCIRLNDGYKYWAEGSLPWNFISHSMLK